VGGVGGASCWCFVSLFMIHGSDEYILPKIAERDLRRFCNLRSTSSDLGLKLPLHEVLLFFLSLVLPVSLFLVHYSRQIYDMRGFCLVTHVLETYTVVLLVLPWNTLTMACLGSYKD
jgi:hypothetical protein